MSDGYALDAALAYRGTFGGKKLSKSKSKGENLKGGNQRSSKHSSKDEDEKTEKSPSPPTLPPPPRPPPRPPRPDALQIEAVHHFLGQTVRAAPKKVKKDSISRPHEQLDPVSGSPLSSPLQSPISPSSNETWGTSSFDSQYASPETQSTSYPTSPVGSQYSQQAGIPQQGSFSQQNGFSRQGSFSPSGSFFQQGSFSPPGNFSQQGSFSQHESFTKQDRAYHQGGSCQQDSSYQHGSLSQQGNLSKHGSLSQQDSFSQPSSFFQQSSFSQPSSSFKQVSLPSGSSQQSSFSQPSNSFQQSSFSHPTRAYLQPKLSQQRSFSQDTPTAQHSRAKQLLKKSPLAAEAPCAYTDPSGSPNKALEAQRADPPNPSRRAPKKPYVPYVHPTIDLLNRPQPYPSTNPRSGFHEPPVIQAQQVSRPPPFHSDRGRSLTQPSPYQQQGTFDHPSGPSAPRSKQVSRTPSIGARLLSRSHSVLSDLRSTALRANTATKTLARRSSATLFAAEQAPPPSAPAPRSATRRALARDESTAWLPRLEFGDSIVNFSASLKGEKANSSRWGLRKVESDESFGCVDGMRNPEAEAEAARKEEEREEEERRKGKKVLRRVRTFVRLAKGEESGEE